MIRRSRTGVALVAGLILCACSGVYYGTMERLGKHKRDILADRVRAGQEDQRDAEEQFVSTYALFKQATGIEGGELENYYNKLSREFEASEGRAERVRERIASIETVAEDLFDEWSGELEQISDATLRRKSNGRLRETRQRYTTLIRAMKRVEGRMDPVLTVFRDRVLYLKHNLNAQAVADLEGVVVALDSDVDALIQDMRRSIREAETFLSSLES